MKKSSMRQKSRDELEAFISESEALIAQKKEEIGWAKEFISKKADEIELVDGIYYAKAKGSAEVLLVEVSNFKACSYIDPGVYDSWGVRDYRFVRKLNVRIIKDKFVINHDHRRWELELLVPEPLGINLTQVSVLSEYERMPIIRQWVKLLNSYQELKRLINKLISRVNEYYGLSLGEITDENSDLFLFTDKDKYKEFIARSTDSRCTHNRLVVVRNMIDYIREFVYSRNVGKIRNQIESKLKWYDKQLDERNKEMYKL